MHIYFIAGILVVGLFLAEAIIKFRYRDNGKYVKTLVKDEGMGIDEEYHDILYHAFSTTPNRPTNNESKSGLGLAIVKKIVELHHGKVGFNSVKGSGSEFYFCIPISQISWT